MTPRKALELIEIYAQDHALFDPESMKSQIDVMEMDGDEFFVNIVAWLARQGLECPA
jgi:hypothetical protein